MPDPSPASDPNPASEPQPAAQSVPTDAGHMPMTEEMDSAKWRLPPLAPVLVAAAIVAIVVALFTFVLGRPLAVGKILDVTTAEQMTKDSVLVAINIEVTNVSRQPVIIKDIHVEMAPAANAQEQSVLQDEAASALDHDRYFQAYPALAQNKIDPLRPETRLQPGETQRGRVIVNFPVNQQAFDQRKSLKVVINLYDHSVPVKIQQ